HVATLDRSQLEYVVDQTLHTRSVLSYDRQETVTTLSSLHRTVFEGFDERDDGREWRARFVRDVGKEFLPHMFETFGAGDVEEHAKCTLRAVSVDSADRNHAQIEDLALW